MDLSVTEQADAWIALQRLPDTQVAPEDVFDNGFQLNDFVHENPDFAWEVIKDVANRYVENEVFTEADTEAKRVLGMLGAGPLEDLLADRGDDYIDRIEAEANRNRCFFWALACVWRSTTSESNWARVQAITGGFSP